MEEFYRTVVRDREQERLEWAKQDHLARFATEGMKKSPASVRLAFRMRIAIGVALVSLAALALYTNMYIGLR